ncbi:MAG: hypothetical protein ACJ76H_11510 [Bacteriovoracaceae bacterium]
MRITLFLLLCFLVSCGNHHSSKHSSGPTPVTPTPTITPQPEHEQFISEQGSYALTFTPTNIHYSKANAKGKLILSPTDLTISVSATKLAPKRSIYQRIYYGECPSIADDRNGDGIVDIQEALPKLGHLLISLDTDINSESDSHSVFPVSSFLGKYSYSAKGNRATVLSDIEHLFDVRKIDLESAVVLLQGLPTYQKFPNSVESSDSLPASETLPIACGTISKN